MAKIRFGKEVKTSRALERSRDYLIGKMIDVKGGTGSGKSLFLVSFVLQLIRPRSARGRKLRDCVTVINFSEDLFFFHKLWETLKKLGLEIFFKWFSLDPLDETFNFDLLQSCLALPGSASRKANFVCYALSIVFQEGFGSGFFSRLNVSTMTEAFERLALKGILHPNLDALASELREMAKERRGGKDAAEALYALDMLRGHACLRKGTDPEKNIDVDRALEECWLTYCALPTLQEGMAARAVGMAVLWSFVHQAAFRKKTGKEPRINWIIVEEAAQIIHSPSFADVLTLARKLGIQLICSYQSSAQLRGNGKQTDMSKVMHDNCWIRVFFTTGTEPNGPDMQELQGYSADRNKPREGITVSKRGDSFSSHDHETPRLERNDARDVNDRFGRGFFIDGYKEPVAFDIDFPCSEREHEELSNRAFPAAPTPPSDVSPTPRIPDPAPAWKERIARRKGVLELIKKEIDWK